MKATATLNVGLDGNDGTKLDLTEVVQRLNTVGLMVTVTDLTLGQSATELTAIVRVEHTCAASIIGAVYLACGPLRQDCIATRIDCEIGNPVGFLVGPNAVKWGEFNPAYFLE